MNPPVEDILLFLDKQLSGDKLDALQAWRNSSVENELEFQKYVKTWEASSQALEEPEILQINTTEALNKVNSEIDKSKVVPLFKRRVFLAVAASMTLLFCAYFILNQSLATQNIEESFSTTDTGRYIDLPDKSRVWMEANSSLSFVNKFEDGRNIKVNGEIFIDVVRNTSSPFTIQTENLEVQVLGTSFIVSDRADLAHAHVSVVSGKVSVSTITNTETIIIEKDESVSFNKESQVLKSNEEILNFNHLYKHTKLLRFEETEFSQVLNTLTDLSGIPIKLENPSLKDCIFTGSFNNKTVLEILEAMKPIYKFNIYSENNQYLIRGGNCNK